MIIVIEDKYGYKRYINPNNILYIEDCNGGNDSQIVFGNSLIEYVYLNRDELTNQINQKIIEFKKQTSDSSLLL